MTHEDVIKWFENYPPLCIFNEKDGMYDEVPQEVISFVERALRSVASASADAEKGYKAWFFESIRTAEGVHVNSDGSTMMRSELIEQAYLAGHAARQGEVDALRAELESVRYAAKLGIGVEKMLHTDLDAMCGEVERLDSGLDEHWRTLPGNDRPPRVSEILAARKEEMT